MADEPTIEEAKASLAEIAERWIEELVKERDEARSDAAFYAKTLMRLRDRLGFVVASAEDEGDRVYFGSTNHFEDLKEVFEVIEGLHWGKIMASSQPPVDLHAIVTTLKAEVEELKRRPDMLKQLLDDANAAHFDATMRADEAESRLASLTGQVEDALGRAAKEVEAEADHWKPRPKDVAAMTPLTALAHNLAADILFATAKRIRSLPVLPTTGDGGETP